MHYRTGLIFTVVVLVGCGSPQPLGQTFGHSQPSTSATAQQGAVQPLTPSELEGLIQGADSNYTAGDIALGQCPVQTQCPEAQQKYTEAYCSAYIVYRLSARESKTFSRSLEILGDSARRLGWHEAAVSYYTALMPYLSSDQRSGYANLLAKAEVAVKGYGPGQLEAERKARKAVEAKCTPADVH